jgi:pyruvate dehydrogenase E2 component (dihydrolipoamide acetyltransferase)
MERGTFLGWLKQNGQFVNIGEPLYELEGEKASQEIEAVDAGVLRIPPTAPAPGTELPVGALLGFICSADEPLPWTNDGNRADLSTASTSRDHRSQHSESSPTKSSPSVRPRAPALGVDRRTTTGLNSDGRIVSVDLDHAVIAGPTVTSISSPSHRRVASPRARRTAATLGIDWRSLSGTGRNGRVRERDVLVASKRSIDTTTRQVPVTGEQRIPVTSRRRVIAERMLASHQQTAPVTLTTRADVTELVKLRKRLKASGGTSTIPSYTDIITKLVAAALTRRPRMAGRWDGDHIVLPSEIHIGIAVDTDDGLLVPVVRNVTALSIQQIAERSRQVIGRARAGSLTAAEMQDGAFTISNLGAYGIDAFTPIINYPQTAILGLGAIRRELVVEDDVLAIRGMMTLSLTFDHRVIDGAPAARFLAEVRESLRTDVHSR